MWFAAAMAVGSLLSSNSQRNAQMKAKAADAKLQRAKLERARLRSTEDYVENSQRAREAAQQREVQIEENRLDSEAKMAETFAGSGISGQSISELDDELNASVMKNKLENKRALDTELADMARDYSQGMNDSAEQAKSIDTTAVKGSFLEDTMNAAQAAQSVSGISGGIDSALSSVGNSVGSFFKNEYNKGINRKYSKTNAFTPSRAMGLGQRIG